MCKIPPVYRQFMTIVCCNLLTFSFGVSTGWATINYNELQNNNSTGPLSLEFPTGPLTLEESALVVSLINLGGFLGNFIVLPMNHCFGIKRTIHLSGIPLILSALLIIWAQNVYFLYASRILSGLVGGAVSLCIASLINDISHDNVRGALNSLYDPLNNTGLFLSFLLGNYFNWMDQAKIQLVVPIIFMILMFFLPESPEYLTTRNKDKRAIKAHKFYKGSIAALERAEFIEKSKLEKGGKANDDDESNTKLTFKDFCTPLAKRVLFISFTSLTLNFLSGTFMILSYVTDIFTKTGSALSAENSSILVSLTQISANIILLNIIERFNRRTLLITSSILTTISFGVFAVYCMLWQNKPGYEWIPTVSFSAIILFSWLGMIPIPFIVSIEIFPKKIRQVCLALAISLMWIILFVLGTVFPIFMETVGLIYSMIIFGTISFMCALFGIFFVPETRGKSHEEIMLMLSK